MKEKFAILYVDDEETNLRIFKNTFHRKYFIHTATNALEGIEILNKEKIDLIISDQRMPGMSGVEFFKQTLKTNPGINRILVTGFTDFNALQSAINEAKIFRYIQKPWKEKDLRGAIENALKVYRLELENKELTDELEKTNKDLIKINSRLRSSNEELIIAKNKAEESDRLKSVFFTNISHEIRTPMNAIIGFARLLNTDELTDLMIKEYLQIIVDSSEQLLQIIEDIIEASQLRTSRVKVRFKPFDISALLKNLIAIYKDEANEKLSIILNNQLNLNDNIIVSDEIKLIKILNNLMENAIKYTSKGYVKLTCKRNLDFIEFYIEDTGIGIAPKNHELIFNRFRQEDENANREFDGLGLGLSIVKDNLKLLNGEIKLISEKGKGATFIVKIPYEKGADVIDSGKQFQAKKIINTLQNKYIILIVEDKKSNLQFLKTLLLSLNLNLKIIIAKDGQEAIEICKKNKEISLVFMDIKMPGINGFEATREIKKLRKNLPVIAPNSLYYTRK